MLNKENFRCDRCGECCKFSTVKITEKEIKDINELGYQDFFEFDKHINTNVLRHSSKGCIFLYKQGKNFCCRIYNLRPKVCRDYPFVQSTEVYSCKPDSLKLRYSKSKAF